MRTLRADVDWMNPRKVVSSFLYCKGHNYLVLTIGEQWEMFCLGDGFGNLTSDELEKINSGWDMSHVRDSSDEAIARIAIRIYTLVIEG
ncbi:MAG TPA: hypothetical protein VI911_07110 [Patescibacteria group bacterium]|nr:hypothetical protein [Patescibacteria group bacterium]